jgi:hypothetical protein
MIINKKLILNIKQNKYVKYILYILKDTIK